MKNKITLIFSVFLLILISNLALADENPCSLDVSLVNQDPHPAVPGEYTEVLFQISGINNACDGVSIDLVLDYPFSLYEGESFRTMEASTYAGTTGNSNWNTIYKIKVDENAVEKDYQIELRYKEGTRANWEGYVSKKFNITVEEVRTEFEVYVKNYKIFDKTLILEILNTGDQDIQALTVEIPKQDNIIIKGSNRNIVGDLDSNEYTTADFEAIPQEGNVIVYLYYTDSINERRMLEKKVYYDPSYFVGSTENTKPSQTPNYIITGIIIILIVLFFVRRHKRKKKLKNKKEFNL